MGDVKFRPAPDEVRRIAKDLTERLHPDIIGYDVRVVFLFRDKPQTLRGSQCQATCKLEKGLSALMSRVNPALEEMLPGQVRADGGAYFIIQIHDEAWSALEDHGKRALIHHELCHVGAEEEMDSHGNTTGKIKLSVTPHDFERFNSEIAIFGAWDTDIERLMRTCSPYIKHQLDTLDAEEQAHFDKMRRRGGVFSDEGIPSKKHLRMGSADYFGMGAGSA